MCLLQQLTALHNSLTTSLYPTPTVLSQALKALREMAGKVQKLAQDAPPATETSTAAQASSSASKDGGKERVELLSKEDEEQSQLMLALGALLSRDPSAAVQVG